MDHPFIDGNKRTGYLSMEALLRFEGYRITSNDEELYNFVIGITIGAVAFDAIAE